jgi:hypothetical protein
MSFQTLKLKSLVLTNYKSRVTEFATVYALRSDTMSH